MRGLTLWQPWATAITHLGKRIENRTWPAPDWIRGQRIAIHAGKRYELGAWSGDVGRRLAEAGLDPGALPRGAIVGTALVMGSTTESSSEWFSGPHGWLLKDVLVLPKPIPCRGAQGLWNVPPEVLKQIQEAKCG